MLNKKRKLIMIGSILGLSTISTAIGLGVGLTKNNQTQINHTESKIDSNKSQILIKKREKNKEELKPINYEDKTTQFIEEVKNNNLKSKELSTKPLKNENKTEINKINQLIEDLKTTNLESSNHNLIETITTTDFNTNTTINDDIKYRWINLKEKSNINLNKISKQLNKLTLEEIKNFNHIEVGKISKLTLGFVNTYKLGLKTQIFENQVVLSLSHENINSLISMFSKKYDSSLHPFSKERIKTSKYKPDSVYLHNPQGYLVHWFSKNNRRKFDGKTITDAIDNFIKFDFKLVFNKNSDNTYSLDIRNSNLSFNPTDFINYYLYDNYYQGSLIHYRLNPISINSFALITKNATKKPKPNEKYLQSLIEEQLRKDEEKRLIEYYKNKTIEDLIIKKEE